MFSVASLHLDTKNPRIGRETLGRAPREIIQYLFVNDKAIDVARSIVRNGYFPNEPLLAIKEEGQHIVVEGNRRLAALKALREPGLLEGTLHRQVERLNKQVEDIGSIASVPVTVAPSRRATDRQIASRHVGTAVRPWEAENRASFILDKLEDGYTNEQLQDQLGFSLADIQAARQTRAIADMARSLELSDEIKAKIQNPRAGLYTTLGRVFDSTVGRAYLHVEPDTDHGIRGTTTKAEFLRGFTKVVEDVALGNASSRSLNTNENIKDYFESWGKDNLPAKKRGSFIPADIVKNGSVASQPVRSQPKPTPKKGRALSATVIPSSFKIRHGNDRLIDLRRELVKLKREEYPNAGAILLRVFLELSIVDYLERTDEMKTLTSRLQQGGARLPHGFPEMKQLAGEAQRIARSKLKMVDARKVERALRYDKSAPFSITELHAFVHSDDFPSARDVEQFWKRTEPLFRLMLEQD